MIETLDLTQPIDESLPIYSEGDYYDPPFHMQTWCTIAEQGYRVAQVQLGTQTGTHIDAPVHFAPNGAFLDALPASALIGAYRYVNLAALHDEHLPPSIRQDTASILFATSSTPGEQKISAALLDALLDLPCPVWVTVYGIQIVGREPFYFHKALAKHGIYLVEDLDVATARRVRPGGELFALPLRLGGPAAGAPCRVVVRQEST